MLVGFSSKTNSFEFKLDEARFERRRSTELIERSAGITGRKLFVRIAEQLRDNNEASPL